MDCKTARLMLEFARPKHNELDPLELRALEAHVAACPECSLNSTQERACDEQLGQAMCKVDVPDQLRARLLTRLKRERTTAEKWRVKRYVVGSLAVAATLLLVLGIWKFVYRATLPSLNLPEIAKTTLANGITGSSKEAVEKDFREQGIEMTAPAQLNYGFLAFHGMGELQKRPVPCLIFIRDDNDANIHANALVYVVSDQEFNLSKLPDNFQSEPGYKYKVELERQPGSRCVYVIVHTGENIDWLRQSD